MRKSSSTIGCALAGALCLSGLPTNLQADDDELTVVSWGGAYTRSQILGFVRDFENTTDVDVDMIDYDGGLEEIRSQVRAYNIKWDVVDLEVHDAIQACNEGLLVRFDHDSLLPAPDGTPASEDFLPGALMPCGIGNVAASTIIAYSANGPTPERLEDFFDTDRFPGRRGLRRSPRTNMEWALIADGVPAEDVYQVLDTDKGVDRAFRMLDRIKPHVDWWELGEQAVRLLETGQVVMTSAYNGRISTAMERGEPLAILWDHQARFIDVWGIPKHSKREELAKSFVRFATSTRSLASQAQYIAYGPLRRSSLAALEPERLAMLPTAPDNERTMFKVDPEWWARNLDELGERFERWIERPVMVPRDWPAR